MIRTLFIYLLAVVTTIGVAASCSASQPKYHPGGPYYYKSWASYYLPYRPVEEISKQGAEELDRQGYAYYIAFFNEQGLIKSFEKRFKENMEFKVTYDYDNGVLKKEEAIDMNGKVKITSYDKDGKRMNP